MLKFWYKKDNYKRSFFIRNEIKKNILKNLMASNTFNLNSKIFFSRKILNITPFASISFYRRSCNFLVVLVQFFNDLNYQDIKLNLQLPMFLIGNA